MLCRRRVVAELEVRSKATALQAASLEQVGKEARHHGAGARPHSRASSMTKVLFAFP